MAVLLLDECVSRSTASFLRQLGHRTVTLQRLGLRSISDDLALREAVRRRAILLTADHDFSNLLRYPLNSHYGIIVMRWLSQREAAIHAALRQCLMSARPAKLRGCLVIVDQFGYRLIHS